MRSNHIFLAIITAAAWGCSFIFVSLALRDLPPYLLSALRFMFSALPAVFFLPKPPAPFRLIVAYGVLMFGLQFALLFAGIHAGMPPGLASLIFQCQVFFSLLLAALFLNEIPTPLQIIGALISLSGLALVWIKYTETAPWVGLVLVLSSAACMAGGNLLSRKLAHAHPMTLVAWGNLVSVPLLITLSYHFEGPQLIWHSLSHMSMRTIGSMIFIVYVSTWVGYSIWNHLLRIYPVATVIPFTLLVPVFGILVSNIVLAEPIQDWKLLAFCLIILGLSTNMISSRMLARRQKMVIMTEAIE